MFHLHEQDRYVWEHKLENGSCSDLSLVVLAPAHISEVSKLESKVMHFFFSTLWMHDVEDLMQVSQLPESSTFLLHHLDNFFLLEQEIDSVDFEKLA